MLGTGSIPPMASDLAVDRQVEILTQNTTEVIPREELERKLARASADKRPLRVKLGIDPSRPDLHLGHAVVLRKLRQFQDLGHTAVLIIGDFTGRVGDPSGQTESRPVLTEAEIEQSAQTYFDQAGKIVDTGTAEVRRNSEWLAPLTMADVLRLTSAPNVTVARMLERDDFQARYKGNRPISIVEFLYPLLQAMDSVAVRADVELGGTDQTFNLLMGRTIQREYVQDPQVVMTLPLLEGLDGVRKMSKSYDNYVGLTEPPEEMFGKLMSIPDHLISRYFQLCTDHDPGEADRVDRGLERGMLHPADEKRRMAREVVSLYHGPEAGSGAESWFDRVFKERQIPDDVHEVPLPADLATGAPVWLPRLMASVGLASSNTDARRLIEQGAVEIGGERVTDPTKDLPADGVVGMVLRVGRKLVRIGPPGESVG
jgi:tyrosyl-tRNA synthetase